MARRIAENQIRIDLHTLRILIPSSRKEADPDSTGFGFTIPNELELPGFASGSNPTSRKLKKHETIIQQCTKIENTRREFGHL